MEKPNFKRKYEELQNEIENQNKRIKLLEVDLESLSGDNKFLIDKVENMLDDIYKLETNLEYLTYNYYKNNKDKDKKHPISNPYYSLRNKTKSKKNNSKYDYFENEESISTESTSTESTNTESTNDIVEKDNNTDNTSNTSNTSNNDEDIQSNNINNNLPTLNVNEILPVIIMASAATVSQMNLIQENEEDNNDGSISPNSKKLNIDKLKINKKKHFKQYTKELYAYFEENNFRNASHINFCIEHFTQSEISIKLKIHHLELCKSLLNNEYINTTLKDLKYFINLNIEEKNNIVSTISNISEYTQNETPIIYDILQRNLTIYQKHIILDKVKILNSMTSRNGEFHKLKKWIDTVMAIPFNIINKLNISIATHSPLLINNYLFESRNAIDSVIHGQTKTKDHIIQIISKLISNPIKGGNVFAIYGPPGTGKTTIIKNGLAKALNMPFAFISLGGATDSSYLDGHNYTYEGSINGKIVDVVIESKCMNPIFYFDELDKVSKTHKGDEIINLLIHLIDSSQNNHFQDKYLAGITLDLSKSIFIFSFNDISLINPILLDRMELIKVDGFNGNEKITIARDYLLPEILNSYSMPQDDIIFSDEIIEYITNFDCKSHTEDGVRNIKRRLENVISKLNVFLISGNLDNPPQHIYTNNLIHSNLPEFIKELGINRPIIITKKIVDILVNNTSHINKDPPFGMYL
jgi:ATP-dependent Lon protease